MRGEKKIFRTKDARDLAQLLRGTFYILSKQQDLAMSDLGVLIEDDSANSKIRANALIKRASLFIQQCKDPVQDPLKVRLIYFLTFTACFQIPNICSNLNLNCSNLLDMRNLQEQVKKTFCYQKLFCPFTV